MDKLSIEEVEKIIRETKLDHLAGAANICKIDVVAQQLADTMRENEKLKKHPLKLICEKCGILTDVEKRNKDSDNG